MNYIDTLPKDARRLHISRYALRWIDMDAFGHVNNAAYFTYFEQSRVDWLRDMGVGHELVLANISCTYIKPLMFPADIDVELYAGRVGSSSMDTYYEIRMPGGADELFALGHGTIVWYDHKAGHSVPIPETVRRQLGESS